MRHAPLFLLILITGLTSGCAGLQIAGGGVTVSDRGTRVGIVLSSDDRAIIARYYAHHKPRRAPPGLAKRGGRLPHGLAKRDTLPPGLRERGLPVELSRQLSPAPAGYVRVIVGSDIVLMNAKTRVVMDIYRDIVR